MMGLAAGFMKALEDVHFEPELRRLRQRSAPKQYREAYSRYFNRVLRPLERSTATGAKEGYAIAMLELSQVQLDAGKISDAMVSFAIATGLAKEGGFLEGVAEKASQISGNLDRQLTPLRS